MFSKLLTATTVALAASLVSAQTHSDCDPTKKDGCPADKAVGSQIIDIDFRKGANDFFKPLEGTTVTYDKDLGGVFSISKVSDAPTIASHQYIFFGQVDVTVRASAGVGVVTSFVLQSDDLDEIDWEWLGGDNTQVQTNFFSKGCTDVYDRGGFSPVGNPVNQFHTYTIKWTPTQLQWIIDGAVVRTLTNTGVAGCSGFPQTPMQIKLGTWVAGTPTAPKGTIEWAGGITDFGAAPYIGYYQSIRIQDFMGGSGATTAGEYVYGDRSGTYQSIKIDGNTSSDSSSSSSSSSSTSTTAKPTTSSASKTSTATTLTTAAPSHSATNNGTTSTSATAVGDNKPSNTTPVPTASHTGAAGKLAGNVVAAGAAALLGYLVL